MDKVNIISTCLTKSDLSAILAKINFVQEIYDRNLEEFVKGQMTDDLITKESKLFALKISRHNLEKLQNELSLIQLEIEKSKKAELESNRNENWLSSLEKYSSITGESLEALSIQISEALKDYEAKNSRYQASPHPDWARRNLLPGVNQAKEYLETLKRTYAEMQSAISKGQSIDLVDLTVKEATTDPETEIPWKTIGMAVGAIVLVVVIVEII